jgi:hypothetical protein
MLCTSLLPSLCYIVQPAQGLEKGICCSLKTTLGPCLPPCNHCRHRQTVQFFLGYQGGGLPPAGHTQHSQANPAAGGPRQSITSEIRLTPLSQEVPSVLTKKSMGVETVQFV